MTLRHFIRVFFYIFLIFLISFCGKKNNDSEDTPESGYPIPSDWDGTQDWPSSTWKVINE